MLACCTYMCCLLSGIPVANMLLFHQYCHKWLIVKITYRVHGICKTLDCQGKNLVGIMWINPMFGELQPCFIMAPFLPPFVTICLFLLLPNDLSSTSISEKWKKIRSYDVLIMSYQKLHYFLFISCVCSCGWKELTVGCWLVAV